MARFSVISVHSAPHTPAETTASGGSGARRWRNLALADQGGHVELGQKGLAINDPNQQHPIAVIRELAAIGQGGLQINEPGTFYSLRNLPDSWADLPLLEHLAMPVCSELLGAAGSPQTICSRLQTSRP